MISENGANWVKVDLHLHSPGVHTFKLPDGTDIMTEEGRRKVVERFVAQIDSQGIKICAITDYNGVRTDWFELIRDYALKKGIYVFPGVELSFAESGGRGLHILAVFPFDVEIDGVNSYIRGWDRNRDSPLFSGREKHRDISPEKPVMDLLKDLKEKFNCLIIIPHPNDTNGFFKAYKPEVAAEILKEIKPDCIEGGIDDSQVHRLTSTGKIDRDTIKRIATVEFSDPKSIEEIGTKKRGKVPRVTYIKIGALDDIDALRIALHDPEVRVRVGEFKCIKYNQILGIDVSGSGFLGDIKIKLHPELNTFIGGRGVGKSAIIEVLRYCLDIPPYAEEDYRESLVEYSLGSGGKVSVYLQRVLDEDKLKKYRIDRIFGKKPIVTDLDSGEEISISTKDIFRQKIPIIIGQREIYHISNDPQKVLQLIDEIIGERLKNEYENFKELIEKLERNAKEIIDLEEKTSKRDELIQELEEIESEIKLFKEYGLAEKLKEATALCEDEETLKKSIKVVEKSHESLLNVFDDVGSKLELVMCELRSGKSSIKGILEKMSNEIQELVEDLTNFKEDINKLFKEKIETIKNLEKEWGVKRRVIDEEIDKIKQEIGISGDLSPDRLIKLTQQKKKLNDQIKELKKFEGKLKERINERRNLISEIREHRHQLFEIRRKSIEEINSFLEGRLRLTIRYQSEKSEFRKNIKEILKGSRVSEDAIEKICSKGPIDGIDISQVIENGIDKIKNEYGLTDTMARRLYNWFMEEKSKLYKLQTLFPEDIIDIELNVEGEYKQLDKLSAGQRATAILLLLFAQEDRILILDQPEEDLDNRFIYDDIVKILRKMKGKRQIIIATHNANIPVLGDSELIFVLDAKENKCCVIDEGSIDKKSIQQHVKSIMEGGEEAFRKRAEKYGDILS